MKNHLSYTELYADVAVIEDYGSSRCRNAKSCLSAGHFLRADVLPFTHLENKLVLLSLVNIVLMIIHSKAGKRCSLALID